MSIFIIKTAIELLVPALSELMEASLPPEMEAEIRKALLSYPDVADPHNLRTRKIGGSFAVDVHVRMNGGMPVMESHEITRDMERRIREILGGPCYITIHVEPKKCSPYTIIFIEDFVVAAPTSSPTLWQG